MVAAIKKALRDSPPSVKAIIHWMVIPPFRAFFRYAPFLAGKRRLWNLVGEHLYRSDPYVTARTVFGSKLYLDASDPIGRYIYYFGVWEPNLTSWINLRLRPGDTFIDVGANVGYFSLLASKLVGDSGRVVAIEALPQIFRVLARNLKINEFAQNVRGVNMAAWNEDAKIQVFTRQDHPPGVSTTSREWATRFHLDSHVEVPAVPLTTILQQEEMETARLIKIDVEGAEWRVLSAMKPMLRSSRDDLEIVVEVTPKLLEAEGTACETLLDFFRSWGFYPYRIDNDYSELAYVARGVPSRPTRIEKISRTADQTDVVFSRVDASSL